MSTYGDDVATETESSGQVSIFMSLSQFATDTMSQNGQLLTDGADIMRAWSAPIYGRLRAMVAPSLPKLYEGVYALSDELGLLADVPESSRRVALFSMMQMFSGAALTRTIPSRTRHTCTWLPPPCIPSPTPHG